MKEVLNASYYCITIAMVYLYLLPPKLKVRSC